ncbi:TPA: hypothetical protein ACXDAB_003398 [Clostridium botulinum]|uniref:hypothetical protein n=1 Tax=Clostridium botulinum TaxID=1491 RepID=UPI00214988B8|nr:hypothetical protein [Clostridium botulinum]MCR1167259.1 hypothetical protein [Clostridium botulinum]
MATSIYKKVNFTDRLDNKPNIYLVDGKETKIIKDDSGVVTHGTNLDQENLDHVENGILQATRDINMLDKMLEKNIEDNTTKFEELQNSSDKQADVINKIMGRLTFMTCRRSKKVPSGLFQQVRWYDEDNKLYALSDVSGDTSGDDFTPKNLSFHFYQDGNVIETYIFNLKFDAEKDLTEMELI